MRFNCGPDKWTKRRRREQKMLGWHKHFCWWPVRLAEGDCRWLETVERKYNHWNIYGNYGSGEEYREISINI